MVKNSMKFILLNIFYLLTIFLFSTSSRMLPETVEEATLTVSQKDIKALNDFLKEVANPALSIPQKIEKYKKGFDGVIKKDSAATSIDDFIMTFIGFVTNVVASEKATINDIQTLFDLYAKIRGSNKLTSEQQNKLSVANADAIKRKLDVQKLFKSQLMSAAQAIDFKAKFPQYRDLFITGLNDNINQENRNLWVIGIGQLVTAALNVGKKESDEVKGLLNDVLKNKSYENKRKLFSDEQKKLLNEYANLLEPTIEAKTAAIVPGATSNVNTVDSKKSVKPVAKNFKNSKMLAKK